MVGSGGEDVASAGDGHRGVFVRSTAKPFQATACLEVLGEAAGELSSEEVAVSWASHRAEDRHLDAVGRLLARADLDPDKLTCPPAPREAVPGSAERVLHHNCSGKHALFALAGRTMGIEGPALLERDGPLQRYVLGVVAEALGPPSAVAIDGCGAPAVAVPLRALADGYRQVLAGGRWERVRDAAFAHPGLLGGQGRLETTLLGHGIISKLGAEGVYAAAWAGPRGAWGAAVKCEDGSLRGAAAVLHGLLAAVGAIDEDDWASDRPSGGGEPVGEVRATAALSALAADIA